MIIESKKCFFTFCWRIYAKNLINSSSLYHKKFIIILGMYFGTFLNIINNSLFIQGFKFSHCAIEKSSHNLCSNWSKLELDRMMFPQIVLLSPRTGSTTVVSVPHSQPEITVTVTRNEYRPRSTVNLLIVYLFYNGSYHVPVFLSSVSLFYSIH